MHNRAILTSLRAAAIIVIATGLNEVIAGAEPRYEPVYVYLVAVAVVTWLDGALLGGLAAVFAAFYAMLFMPRMASWTMTRLTPAGAMLAVVIVVALLRALFRRKPRPAQETIFTATATPLLAAPVEDHTEELLAAIDDLRTELRAGLSEIHVAREPDRSAEIALENVLAEERRRSQAVSAEASLLRMEVEQARRDEVVRTARIAELERLLERARLDAEYAHEQTAALAGRVAELEPAARANEQSRRDIEESLGRASRALDDAERLRGEVAAGREHVSRLNARIKELEAALVDTARISEERDALAGRVTELQLSAHEAERARLDAVAAHERLDNELRAERARAIATRAETGALTDRIRELEVARERLEAELRSESMRTEAARAEAEELAATLEHERAAFDTKLNTIVSHLASDHESDLGQALTEREAARAEARLLKTKVQDLEGQLEKVRAAVPVAPQKPRVLVAHPDADARAAAKASLDRAGYEVVTAADGLEALRLAVAELPNVVIADAIMPKMNGRELCQLLKSQDKTAHIRVILLLRSIDEQPTGELAPDEVLRKPVPPETLRGKLATLLSS